jgi:FkbM family methyltransferase
MKLSKESKVFVVARWLANCINLNPRKYIFFRWLKMFLQGKGYNFEPNHKWILDKYVKEGTRVLDIGANEGGYIKRFLKRGAVVIAFEPFPELAHRLRKKFKGMHVYIYALGKRKGIVKFYKGEYPGQGSTCLKDVKPKDCQLIKVNMRTLDSFHFCADFIKIDAQGMDYDILIGAKETLKNHKPIVLAEYYEDGLKANGQTGIEMIKYMDELGYKFQTVQIDGEVNDILFIPRQ